MPDTIGELTTESKPSPAADVGIRWQSVAATVTVFGVLVALFAGYLFGFTSLEASRSQTRLLLAFHGPAGLAALTGKVPTDGQPVALLAIPSLGLHQVVVEGTGAGDLAEGPGLMSGSALPGLRGNTVIAGHSLLFGGPFHAIGSLHRGAAINVVGGFGSFEYRVVRTFVVRPGQADPVVPTADARLTLVTSGVSLVPSDRIVAIARMVSHPVSVEVASSGLPPSSAQAFPGDHRALLPTVLWSSLLVVGLVATVAVRRRWSHPWSLYLMAMPVLLALAALSFEQLAQLLPATL